MTGLIRANPYVVIADHTYIICRGPKGVRYRAIMQYIDEVRSSTSSTDAGSDLFVMQSWVGKAKFAMQGLIHEVEGDGTKEMEWMKLKNVPEDKVLVRFEGSWRGDIKVTKFRDDKVGRSRPRCQCCSLTRACAVGVTLPRPTRRASAAG